jgi:hypothetical protein
LIIVETDPGVGQGASQFRGSVNWLPLAASLSPPHFASSFDDPRMLKFSHSFLYFIDHVDLPFSSVCWWLVECLLKPRVVRKVILRLYCVGCGLEVLKDLSPKIRL